MNENRTAKTVVKDAEAVIIIGLAAYGTYVIARIGYEWIKVGIQTIKKHKVINI